MPDFAIKALDHVVLRVADIDRAIRFYCDVLGCREERRVESIGLVQLRAGAAMIDLVPRAAGEAEAPGNMDHFAITIQPFDPAALKAHFAAHGITLGDVARRYGAEGYGPSLYLYDPDGNQVELKGPPEA
ncbi:MAG: VOC family protein [Alphaproteobacteria bacterium]|nr:VOC family protein [Alphaproteobacteria bacterium]MCB9929780.1 VOC family protein [Alphaproteobacteria bacterium]